MNIVYKNYTLEPEGRNYNLYKTVKAKKVDKLTKQPTGEEYEKDINYGYAMTFEICVETIIKDMLCEREEAFSLRQYIDEYKQLKCNLLDEIDK